MKYQSETVILNGIESYYEIHGDGEPLLLLHGWTQSSSYWKEYIPHFADRFQVYTVDLLGHGRSSPLQGKFSLGKAADNLIKLMDHLGLNRTKAVGFSYGGETLLRICAEQTNRFISMILIGSSHRFPKQDWGMNYQELQSDYKKHLLNIHVHGDVQVRRIFEQMPNYESLLSKSQLKKISTRTLVMVGENDRFVTPDVALDLYKSLPHSHLWIVPHAGHEALAGSMKPEFLRIGNEFLTGKWAGVSPLGPIEKAHQAGQRQADH